MNKNFYITIICISLLVGMQYIDAWNGPTSSAPTSTLNTPLNSGSIAQVKDGSLGATEVLADTVQSPLYCNADGTVCTKPLPTTCNSGDLIIADGAGGWSCNAVLTPTVPIVPVVARFNTKYVGLIFDPAFQTWLGPNTLPTKGADRNNTTVWSNDLGWYSKDNSRSAKWLDTVDKICSFMMTNGTAATKERNYFNREKYGSVDQVQSYYWDKTAGVWVLEWQTSGNTDVTELSCTGTAVTTAGNRWLTTNLTYPNGDVLYNPFWNTSLVWINN